MTELMAAILEEASFSGCIGTGRGVRGIPHTIGLVSTASAPSGPGGHIMGMASAAVAPSGCGYVIGVSVWLGAITGAEGSVGCGYTRGGGLVLETRGRNGLHGVDATWLNVTLLVTDSDLAGP